MTEAKRQIEELKADRQMAVAMAKRDFHVQLEARDDELTKCRKMITQTQTENDALKAALEQAKQSGSHFISITCAYLSLQSNCLAEQSYAVVGSF